VQIRAQGYNQGEALSLSLSLSLSKNGHQKNLVLKEITLLAQGMLAIINESINTLWETYMTT
jgi:hypothetical protein